MSKILVMKKFFFAVITILVLSNCTSDPTNNDLLPFIPVDEETDCEGYNSIIPSGNGITGTFTIRTVLPYFYTNHDPMNGEAGCSYITFTGNYNKSTSTLSSIVKSYYGDWVYAGWIRHKYQISATDMWWLPRAEPNTFRLVFNMDHIYQRRDGSGTYTDYQVLSDGRYVDFVVE